MAPGCRVGLSIGVRHSCIEFWALLKQYNQATSLGDNGRILVHAMRSLKDAPKGKPFTEGEFWSSAVPFSCKRNIIHMPSPSS